MSLANRLDQFLTHSVPFGMSGAVLVAQNGEIVLNKGYGWAKRVEQVSNTNETAFSIGSITKQFTAACIMLLEQDGKLNTHDPISRYLGNVPTDKADVTLHHLLTHTAGFTNYTGEDFIEADREHAISTSLEAPLLHPPGTQYAYSNAGFSVLAAIVEIVSGQPYERFLQTRLLAPAGMAHTGYRAPDWSERTVAHWYVGDKDNRTPLEKPYPQWNLLGNGGILSNTLDLFRWYEALRGDGLFSAETKTKLFTPFLNDYAYGWDVQETEVGKIIEHDGASVYGSSAVFRWYVDADILLVILCNSDYHGTYQAGVVRDKIAPLIFGETVPPPPATIPVAQSKIALLAGRYQLAGGGTYQLSLAENGFLLTAQQQDAINAVAFSEGDSGAVDLESLNQRATVIFEAIHAGNYEPLQAELDDEARVERYRELFTRNEKTFREMTGEERVEAVRVLGTIPSFLADAVMTVVQFQGREHSYGLNIHWIDGKWYGVNLVETVTPFRLDLRAVGDSTYVGYDLRTTHSVTFQLSSDPPRLTVVDNQTVANKM